MPRKNKDLIALAKEMRRNKTKEQSKLWNDFLAKHPVKFTSQEVIGDYIADFYCDRIKLVVEINSGKHLSGDKINYDRLRTDYFNELGIKVLSFDNKEINESFVNVCRVIDRFIDRFI